MSNTVDSRVVEMRFDNKHFENNVQTSMSTLDKLKQSLKLPGAAKGLEEVGYAAKNCNLSPLGNAVEGIRMKFSAMQIMATTALANVTNSAVNAGKRIMSALTIDPIKMGLSEYETQINAVQTILANTKSKGTTIDQVNTALDELNTYADKTIYNFTEMTRNIGTFTAAGIDLDTSVNAIQGIANLAAVSGSNSQQASTAMYQLSQALATGTVKLMDWNSVVNAGMGGQLFQDALKKTSEELGTGAAAAIEAQGSFRESLSEGWLTSEVLTKTLKKFTTSGANEYIAEYTGLSKKAIEAEIKKAEATYGEADAIEYASKALAEKSGKDADEIKQALDFARTAEDAATKVKTFTQLIDTLKEGLQSGWTQSWEIIIGDFEEAKELWSSVSDYFGNAINKSAEARNNLLQAWKDGGGRDDLFAGIKNAFDALLSVVKPIKEAFRDIFPPLTAKNLLNITERFRDFTKNLILSEDKAVKVKSIFKGLFSVLDIGKKAIKAVFEPLLTFITGDTAGSIGDKLLNIAASIGDFFTGLNESIEAGEGFKHVSETIRNALGIVGEGFSTVLGSFDGIGGFLSSIWRVISTVAGKIKEGLGSVFGWIKENISLGDVFAGLTGGGIFIAFKKLGDLFGSITDIFEGFSGKGKTKFQDILGGIKESLTSFSNGLKVGSIVAIAAAVALLSSSMKKLSELSPEQITIGLGAIASLTFILTRAFKGLLNSLSAFNGPGIIKAGITMIAVAAAVRILSSSMTKLSGLSWEEIGKGLVGIGGALAGLVIAFNKIGSGSNSIKAAGTILALSVACSIMSKALIKLSVMSWSEIGKSLTAMGGVLAEMVIAVSAMNKFAGKNSLSGAASILIISLSLSKMAKALSEFGSMSWDEIGRGLVGMGSALTEVAVISGALGYLTGLSGVLGAATIWVSVQGLDKLASALERFGAMSWDEIGRGLTAMGGALLEIGVISGALGYLTNIAGLLGAATIWVAVQGLDKLASALERFGSMSWDEIGRGLTAMIGALTSLAVGSFLNTLGILGAITINTTVDNLLTLADALAKFGLMSWDEIGRGITAMIGALASLAVGSFLNTLGILGAITINTTVDNLLILADALSKFGLMSWDEIGRGLSAMAGALGVLASGSLANTLGMLGSLSIATVAEPLGALADSFRKFTEFDMDRVAVGINVMLNALNALALGGFANTISIIGSLSIAAVAEPLGILADSIKKWEDVKIPDGLGANLTELALAISTFILSGLGGISISTVAEPLGILADSVKKWETVVVPENLGDTLSSLAIGISSFSFLFESGWSISAIAGPLGELADDVQKWSGVNITKGMTDGLESLATGISSFSFLFESGWSISAIAGPLGELADDVQKWSNIKVPDNLGDELKKISTAVSTFDSLWDGIGLSSNASAIRILADACNSLSSITVDGTILITFADNVKTACSTLKEIGKWSISGASSTINTLVGIIKKVNGVSTSNVSSFVTAANSLNNINIGDINVNSDNLSSAVSAIKETMNSISSAISGSKSSFNDSMKTAVSGLSGSISNCKGSLTTAINTLISNLTSSIKEKKESATSSFSTLVSGAVSAVKEHYSSMSSAGGYLGDGLVEGINSKVDDAYNAGYALGQAAVQGEKDGQASNSPSKLTIKSGKWFGEGLIIGISSMKKRVYRTGYGIGDVAVSSLSSAISHISDVIGDNIDTQPTIRPVLDLSNVSSGVGMIGSMLGINPSIGLLSNVGSINAMMNRRQNGVNNDIVSAIQDLGKTIGGNNPGNTYNINGITYDDGSNVADAIQTLVRAATVERRR